MSANVAGTTTLFAALERATGLVKASHYQRRRRVEFLHFINRVIADHPFEWTKPVVFSKHHRTMYANLRNLVTRY